MLAPLPGESYLTVERFADLSGFSVSTVRRYLRAGKLPKLQPGGPRSRVVIPISALARATLAPLADTQAKDGMVKVPPSTNRKLAGPPPRWRRLL